MFSYFLEMILKGKFSLIVAGTKMKKEETDRHKTGNGETIESFSP